jgi:ATP/maltotriose-dependent transcriptional regulator MalT
VVLRFADRLRISKVYEKLGAANRAKALMTALRMGLITSDSGGLK